MCYKNTENDKDNKITKTLTKIKMENTIYTWQKAQVW